MINNKTAIIIAAGSGSGAARKIVADGYHVGILSSFGQGEALAAITGGIGVAWTKSC